MVKSAETSSTVHGTSAERRATVSFKMCVYVCVGMGVDGRRRGHQKTDKQMADL